MVPRLVRTAAIGSSIALAAFVIVRAQTGCDATPKSEAPPAAAPSSSALPAEAGPSAKTPPPSAPPAEPERVEPPAPADEPAPEPTAPSPPDPEPEPESAAKKNTKPKKPEEDVKFFPASKSGIDFGQRSASDPPETPEPTPTTQQNAAPQ